jgi:ribA/ribD-fused uncharacterized protein
MLAELVDAERGGDRIKYVFFWGHTPAAGGTVGPHVLSQWWPATFTVDGCEYTSAEQFMMASKARLFGDEEALGQILEARHPREAKMFGRMVRGYDDHVWDTNRFGIVVTGSVAKFGQNQPLRRYLIATAGRVLVEASPRDAIWGIGLALTDPDAGRPSAWRGRNLLGFALMEARRRLGDDGHRA